MYYWNNMVDMTTGGMTLIEKRGGVWVSQALVVVYTPVFTNLARARTSSSV